MFPEPATVRRPDLADARRGTPRAEPNLGRAGRNRHDLHPIMSGRHRLIPPSDVSGVNAGTRHEVTAETTSLTFGARNIAPDRPICPAPIPLPFRRRKARLQPL